MLTLVLTYRNRDLNVVQKCLDSLQHQTNNNFKVILVDYGSAENYADGLSKIISNYSFIKLIYCPVKQQLFNKSKAINIALKNTNTEYFFVADVDMIFKDNFVQKILQIKQKDKIYYFQVGFLTKTESNLNKKFIEYNIKHLTTPEATGMTLYPTKLLKEINGYDEFYHGWGAEDTDVHFRLRNAGYKVLFYDKELLLIHQWHSKSYRSNKSKEPFHSSLEKINHQYLNIANTKKRILANSNFNWGVLPKKESFTKNTAIISLTNQKSEIEALLSGIMGNYKDKKLIVNIVPHKDYKSLKNSLKKKLGKKYLVFYEFEEINNLILETIIARFRNNYYEYNWDKSGSIIKLNIAL